jgi:hypothetical protein
VLHQHQIRPEGGAPAPRWYGTEDGIRALRDLLEGA